MCIIMRVRRFIKRIRKGNKTEKEKKNSSIKGKRFDSLIPPRWGFPLGFFLISVKIEPIKTALVAIVALVINIIIQIGYYITLPIALLNEIIRRIKL